MLGFLSNTDIRTVIGDAFITTKDVMKESKKLGLCYIGKIKKNIIVEYFGKKVQIEKLFKKDLEENKFKLRTINETEVKLYHKVVNIPNVGRVKIVAVLMKLNKNPRGFCKSANLSDSLRNQKEPKYLVCIDHKKKAENIIGEYIKRPMIEEKHRRDKSVLKIEGNYLTSKNSNIGFIRFLAIVSNCIEYLSHKYGLSFYEVVKSCSKELIKRGIP
nr:hypothetical protein [Methanothermococcus okinawensis]